MTHAPRPAAPVETVAVSAYTVPTDRAESDGMLEWDTTTMVLVEVRAGGATGIGYSYTHAAAAALAREKLAPIVTGREALDLPGAWEAMVHETRNLGRPGITSMAIAAVDTALWDLKGKLLEVPVCGLLGRARETVAIYGSGGFTSYTDAELAEQLAGWASEGCTMVKMKVGRDPEADLRRMAVAREAIGPEAALFIDANGALQRKQALAFAEAAAGFGVRWFEEPVSSDDLDGLRLLRDRGPVAMAVAAGEYGFDAPYFRRMLTAGAVDVLQIDATRCAGITGFMAAVSLARAFGVPTSAHCAPALHLHPCLAALGLEHIEWFHDHARIEALLFEGAPEPVNGRVKDNGSPGLGLALKRQDAERFRIDA